MLLIQPLNQFSSQLLLPQKELVSSEGSSSWWLDHNLLFMSIKIFFLFQKNAILTGKNRTERKYWLQKEGKRDFGTSAFILKHHDDHSDVPTEKKRTRSLSEEETAAADDDLELISCLQENLQYWDFCWQELKSCWRWSFRGWGWCWW